MNCQKISNSLQQIKTKRAQLDSYTYSGKITDAVILKNELMNEIDLLLEKYTRAFKIENKKFPVSTLEIGNKSKPMLLNELRKPDIYIGRDGFGVLNKIGSLEKYQRINLVCLTVGELGLNEGATMQDINRRAEELGLEPCPPEVGPYLRLKDQSQALNERYAVAMRPISLYDNRQYVFLLYNDGVSLWLDAEPIKFDYGSKFKLVFRVPDIYFGYKESK